MARIPVPKTPRSAYNPERQAGALLLAQLKHLEWAVRPAAERTPGKIDVPSNVTEAEAAARIARLMNELNQQTVGRAPIIKPTSRRPPRRSRPKSARRRTRARSRRSK
jgi:hypothetical protein